MIKRPTKNVVISTAVVLSKTGKYGYAEENWGHYAYGNTRDILNRTSNSNDRPLLKVENPFEKITELLNFRRPFYEKADILINTENKTPLQIAEEIIEKIKNF
jgi:shikimate kinase